MGGPPRAVGGRGPGRRGGARPGPASTGCAGRPRRRARWPGVLADLADGAGARAAAPPCRRAVRRDGAGRRRRPRGRGRRRVPRERGGGGPGRGVARCAPGPGPGRSPATGRVMSSLRLADVLVGLAAEREPVRRGDSRRRDRGRRGAVGGAGRRDVAHRAGPRRGRPTCRWRAVAAVVVGADVRPRDTPRGRRSAGGCSANVEAVSGRPLLSRGRSRWWYRGGLSAGAGDHRARPRAPAGGDDDDDDRPGGRRPHDHGHDRTGDPAPHPPRLAGHPCAEPRARRTAAADPARARPAHPADRRRAAAPCGRRLPRRGPARAGRRRRPLDLAGGLPGHPRRPALRHACRSGASTTRPTPAS